MSKRRNSLTGIACRQAVLADAAEIHELLLALAPEIPLQADTLEREEALYALIRNCARSGESWVACDDCGRIVGFLLADLTQLGRHYAEHEVVELRYAGVVPAHRGRGIFTRLVETVLGRLLPVTAAIPALNRSAAAACLERLGFREGAGPGGERRFRREPGASQP